MAWNQDLIGSQVIDEESVEQILKAVGAHDYQMGCRRQKWGWSAECDVIRQEDRTLAFHGTRDCALPEKFLAEAQRRGFNVLLGKRCP
jgi:hypothetical protein